MSVSSYWQKNKLVHKNTFLSEEQSVSGVPSYAVSACVCVCGGISRVIHPVLVINRGSQYVVLSIILTDVSNNFSIIDNSKTRHAETRYIHTASRPNVDWEEEACTTTTTILSPFDVSPGVKLFTQSAM